MHVDKIIWLILEHFFFSELKRRLKAEKKLKEKAEKEKVEQAQKKPEAKPVAGKKSAVNEEEISPRVSLKI